MQHFPTIADAEVEPIPASLLASSASTEGEQISGAWVTLPAAARARGAAIAAPTGRWMALERYLPWWPRPAFGDDDGRSAPDGEYFLLLSELADGTVTALLPTIDGDTRTLLHGGPDGWSLRGVGLDPAPDAALAAIFSHGDDPALVIEWAVARLAERLGTFRLRADKPAPRWVENFGWCTWDAFYEEVTAEKVLGGLRTFAELGIPPRTVILDAGWQPVADEMLQGFGTVAERFPDGLAPLVEAAKRDHGVDVFGVWHTLQGYWQGVDPDSALGERYRIVETEQDAGTPAVAGIRRRGLVHPDHAARFFDDYHAGLRAQGVDMVKVDNQGAMEHFATAEVPPTALDAAYQDALQSSVDRHFGGESLHCMSHSVSLAYHLDRATAWRSSQDFFPDEPETHGRHIFDNAVNSLWSSTFALCDWDMFQSGHDAGAFHAAARAISGGPVYVSDKPGRQDAALLRRLMLSDGSVLRSARPARIARRNVFVDGREKPVVTIVENSNEVEGLRGPIGVLGLFSCAWDGSAPAPASGSYAASDVRGLGVGPHVLYHRRSGSVVRSDGGDGRDLTIALPALGWEIVTVAPVEDGIALLGLLDKFNGSRAMTGVSTDARTVRVRLADGGRFGWYEDPGRTGPTLAYVAGEQLDVTTAGPLAWADVPTGGPVEVVLTRVAS